MSLGLADEDQHPGSTGGVLQVELEKLLPSQARGAALTQQARDQAAGQTWIAQQQAQADERHYLDHQQAAQIRPPQGHVRQARYGQSQQRGP